MGNRSKKIGTQAETAVVKVLISNGWPSAERRALAGELDRGDILGTPGITWQVKGGHAAESASDHQIEAWYHSTLLQRDRNNDHVGVLVLKRFAVGADNAQRWWAVLDSQTVANLVRGGHGVLWHPSDFVLCRMTLWEAIALLRGAGYGGP